MKRLHEAQRSESGFTLVEVVVSLALLALLSSAALYFFVNGTRSVTETQRTQNAVSVANEAMELAYAVAAEADEVSNMSGLVTGRTQADVEAAWSLATTHDVDGLDASYPVWDPAPTEPEAIAITRTQNASGVEYTATTLIGSCYRTPGSTDCTRLAGIADDPGTAPSGYTRMMRVMVLVTWPSTTGTCTDGTCSFELSSLADPNSDLTWNNTDQPVAMNDIAEVFVGETVEIDILANDLLAPVDNNPIVLLGMATGSGTPEITGSTVKFTAPPDVSGHMTFEYRLKDDVGRTSNVATVLVKVKPRAVDDTAETTANTPVTIPVTDNDLGTPASTTVTVQPGKGTATAAGTGIDYHPQGNTGTFTLRYTFTDVDQQVSTEAEVVVTVTASPPPNVANLDIAIPVTQHGSVEELDLLRLTNNPDDYLVEIVSVNYNQGRVLVDGREWLNHRQGTSISYQQQGNVLGVWSFQYRIGNPDDVWSDVRTATLLLVPTPVDDLFRVAKNRGMHKINVGSNDRPMNFGGTIQFDYTMTEPTCGSVNAGPDARNGILEFTLPNGNQSCSFTYAIRGTGEYEDIVSDPATVTVRTW